MASKYYVVCSGYNTRNYELGDRKVVLLEMTEKWQQTTAMLVPERDGIGYELRMVTEEQVALVLAGFGHVLVYGYSSNIQFGPRAWEKESREDAVKYARYCRDYPGSEETCKYQEITI